MNHTVHVSWVKDMVFDAGADGHHVIIDAAPEHGGRDQGPRPKPLMLASLGGCTGMDVISILHKMKVFPDAFDLEIIAEVTEEHPKVYTHIRIIYVFSGKNLPKNKLHKAIDLSLQKYCGVSAMLSQASEISYEIKVRIANSE
jgi:putative redox protein